jgi:Flp pilus assembly pilin Flp
MTLRPPQLPALRDEDGQTAVEYVGAILVVSIIIGVLATAAPDIAGDLLRGIRSQIDAILGS